MKTFRTIYKIVKAILFVWIYSSNLFWAGCLWLAGKDGNIMLGILFICFYRLSLWLTPFLVTILCWIPLPTGVPIRKKILFNLVHLVFSALLFVICYLLFGNWF